MSPIEHLPKTFVSSHSVITQDEEQAIVACEDGTAEKTTCRCLGAFYGARRGKGRKFFLFTLPEDDPHSFRNPRTLEEARANVLDINTTRTFDPLVVQPVQESLFAVEHEPVFVVAGETDVETTGQEVVEPIVLPEPVLTPKKWIPSSAFVMKSHPFPVNDELGAIFECMALGTGNAVVKAVPGAGKSTAIFEGCKYINPSGAMILAFNKSIKEDMALRFKQIGMRMRVNTVNGLGHQALARHLGSIADVSAYKYANICDEKWALVPAYEIKDRSLIGALRKLVNMAQMTLANPEDEEALKELVMQYDIEINVYDDVWSCFWPLVKRVLDEGERIARDEHKISFSDQVWLPNLWELVPDQLRFALVDETQDLNFAQSCLVKRSLAPGGRLIAVGDPNQAIYRFSGADSGVIDRLKDQFNAETFPLSTCYRCPSSHIEEAAKIFPGIQPRLGAPRGTIQEIDYDQLIHTMQPGSFVVGRKVRYVVSACMRFLRAHKPAIVKGRDIGGNMVDTFKKLKEHPQFNEWNTANLPDILEEYRQAQYDVLKAYKNPETKIESMNDKVDTMEALVEGFYDDPRYRHEEHTFSNLSRFVSGLFDDGNRNAITCATIHKMKGSEAKSVAVIEPDEMPLQSARTPEQYNEEKCIKYVGLTRSKDEMFFVSNFPAPVEQEDQKEASVF